MRLKKYLFLLLLAHGLLCFSQRPTLSSLAKVSILTVGTADELHSKFGHTAIRLQDPSINLDIVYNYGLFDFDDPSFYVKFTRGKLDYRLGRQKFKDFLFNYQLENRWVKEQVLRLNEEQRTKLFAFLENNYRPENRYYKYDFLFDNCSTRIPAALQSVLGDDWKLDYDHLKAAYTFRELIHQNLEVNSWSNFGIDLALGSVIDRKATPWEHLFLPLYLFKQLPHSVIDGEALVTSHSRLLAERPVEKSENFFLSPLFWLSFCLLAVLYMTYRDTKRQARSRWLDFSLFLVSGLAGMLILFLWFATDHLATKMNFNALWAFAPNLLVAFVILKRQLPAWVKTYLWIVILLLLLTLLLWVFMVQVFSPLILFLLGALLIRYVFLIRYMKKSVMAK